MYCAHQYLYFTINLCELEMKRIIDINQIIVNRVSLRIMQNVLTSFRLTVIQ